MKGVIVGVLAALVLLPNANATPGATVGAIGGGTAAAIICDHVVRSYMETTPESDEAWYLVWHHVGLEDVAGFAAGTVCAIPGAALGAAAGAAVDATVVGSSVTAAGTALVIVVGKGLQAASRTAVPQASGALGHVRKFARKSAQRARQRYGQVKFGSVASSNYLHNKYMAYLYDRQKGMDALCKVPLPPLYVGPPWKRRFNPDIHIDHKFPRAKGGTDDPSNLQLTHKTFNLKKGALTGDALLSAQRRFCPV